MKKLECVNNVIVDTVSCLKPCSGLLVTSFSKSNDNKNLDDLFPFLKAYNYYKKITPYPSGYYGNHVNIKYCQSIFLQKYIYLTKKLIHEFFLESSNYRWRNKLRYVRIYFDTPTFDRVTKHRTAKFVDMLSAIGGTMGLLTGFLIISGVEILYFSAKFLFTMLKK